MSLAGCFAEEMDIIESKMVKKKLLLDHTVDTVDTVDTVAETVVGRHSGRILGHFGSTMSTPEVLNDSVEHGDRLSSHQNRSCGGFGRCATRSTPTAHDFINSHDNLGVSEVDCSQNGKAMVNKTPPDSYGDVVDCGIVDHPLADCSRMTATAVAHQGSFENPFADEWTELEPESQARTAIIDQVIKLCDFPSDSIMIKYIDQQLWSQLVHIVTVGLEEVDEFYTVRDDDITFESTPMLIHLRRFKAFLLYYKSKTSWGDGLTEDDLMLWTPKDFQPVLFY
jgi:hypothetical protein